MAADPVAVLQDALASPDPAQLERVVRDLEAAHGSQPYMLYAKAELARRRGDLVQACAFSSSAVSTFFNHRFDSPEGRLKILALLQACMTLPPARLQPAYVYLHQLGHALEQSGMLHRIAPSLVQVAANLADPARANPLLSIHVATAFAMLGFHNQCDALWAERVVGEVALPWLLAMAEHGHFEAAIAIENAIYTGYVQRQESQAWFKAATARWIPLLAAAARRQRPPRGASHSHWRVEPIRKVAFLLHNATMLAHTVVLIETLKAVREVGPRNYHFTVFVVSGRHQGMHDALQACGVSVRYLDEGRPGAGYFERLLALEEALRQDNFAAVFWVTLVILMAIAFPRRIAPLQGWLAMKYHSCEIDEIDVHMAIENAVLTKRMEGIEWRTFGAASRSWIDPALADAARELRATFPKDAVVCASIGREEKLDSPEFIAAICELLKRHPAMVFLWTGRLPRRSIQGAFDRAGVSERARFVGWVDTKLYALAIDLFLDSFPFPCGFTLKEAMAAGKPAVMMRTPESLETGVPGAISPLAAGADDALGVRARMLGIFTRDDDFDLYQCADSPAQYVDMASRLLGDPEHRARVGAANREFVRAFLSSPDEEARKLLDHLDDLFETIPKQPGDAGNLQG